MKLIALYISVEYWIPKQIIFWHCLIYLENDQNLFFINKWLRNNVYIMKKLFCLLLLIKNYVIFVFKKIIFKKCVSK